MKISLALGLALASGTYALIGGASNVAHAVNANHSGTICKNYNASQATDIDYLPYGTRNLNSSTRFVICPLVTSGNSNATAAVFVDGYAAAGQTINCTLYSYNYKGAFLGATSFSSAQTGTFDIYLKVANNYYDGLSVLCSLPPSAQGIIYDFDVVQ